MTGRWDDIAVATCLPTMSYSPTINPNVCESNPILIADTISSSSKIIPPTMATQYKRRLIGLM